MTGDSFTGTAAMSIAAAATVGAAGYYWMSSSMPIKLNAFVDLNKQTRILEDGSRVAASLDGDNLIPYAFEDAKTVSDALRRGLRESNNGHMLGVRKKQPDGSAPYVWVTYKQVIERSENLARGFEEIGLTRGQNTYIGMFARNRPEWIICEHATYNNRSIIVPIYETLGREACSFIVRQTELQIIIVDDERKALSVFESIPACPSVKYVVVIDPYGKELEEKARKVGVTLIQLSDLEQKGESAEKRDFELPSPDDLCTIAYTSGTTGQPKGVMITHANVVACTAAIGFLKSATFQTGEVMISFLPLAHMFERLLETAAFMCGMSIGYYGGNIKTLTDDIKELKPTIVPVVPRVLNRLYDKVNAELNKSYLKKMLFSFAMASKRRDLQRGILRNTIWDKLVFRKIRESMGGCVKLMITGSAPLSGEVLEFTRIAMGCIVLEGYGQTECVAECTLGCEADTTTGTVGIPVYCSKIKLVDVPELGYFAKDQSGEVCVKGYNVFKGYYKNEELTKETIDADGWLHTGDIGRWTEKGTLKIIDRKKHIFKLSQGEYIAPEKVEAAYTRSKYVAQVFVYGESLKTCLVAIVVPNPDELHALAKELHMSKKSVAELCEKTEIKKAVLNDMTETAKTAGLCSFEQAKDIHLCPEPFTFENDLLTPTLKNKRVKLKKHFAKELAAMYSKMP